MWMQLTVKTCVWAKPRADRIKTKYVFPKAGKREHHSFSGSLPLEGPKNPHIWARAHVLPKQGVMRVPKPKTILENSCTPLCCPCTQAMKFIRLHEHLHIRRPKPDFMKFMISGALPAPRLHEIHEFPGLAEA